MSQVPDILTNWKNENQIYIYIYIYMCGLSVGHGYLSIRNEVNKSIDSYQ